MHREWLRSHSFISSGQGLCVNSSVGTSCLSFFSCVTLRQPLDLLAVESVDGGSRSRRSEGWVLTGSIAGAMRWRSTAFALQRAESQVRIAYWHA